MSVFDAHPTFPKAQLGPSPYVSLYITRKQAETVVALLEGRSVPKRTREAIAANIRKSMGRNA